MHIHIILKFLLSKISIYYNSLSGTTFDHDNSLSGFLTLYNLNQPIYKLILCHVSLKLIKNNLISLGIIHDKLRDYGIYDIDFVVGFDVGENKIGKSINEAIYEEYGFDKKIDDLQEKGRWKQLAFFKSDYIASKDVGAWLGLYQVTKS